MYHYTPKDKCRSLVDKNYVGVLYCHCFSVVLLFFVKSHLIILISLSHPFQFYHPHPLPLHFLCSLFLFFFIWQPLAVTQKLNMLWALQVRLSFISPDHSLCSLCKRIMRNNLVMYLKHFEMWILFGLNNTLDVALLIKCSYDYKLSGFSMMHEGRQLK